ncbi:MAG: hypothetical protein A4E35_00450 [Methanoregula sp. PtaU1.Bin051]|nr:MAG: hypothetical protein A4E35_00450 [Methanoregula sp. PtaU1.Bin051]
MRRAFLAVLAAFLACLLVPVCGAVSMSITATPAQAHIGDTIELSGSITGVKTIAVYLFVTGPGLNIRGVTLENLNIPAGRGLFTTAPVNLKNGRWQYNWDTSVILGNPKPGRYTIYVVSSPVDRIRDTAGEYATADVELLPPENPPEEIPVPLYLPLAALLFVAVAGIVARR